MRIKFVLFSIIVVSLTFSFVSLSKAQTSSLDNVPPEVSITNPLNNAVVSEKIEINAQASDNVRVVGVRFFIDGNLIGYEDFIAPYSVFWYSQGISNGLHTLTAEARDARGNKSISTSIVVDVKNTPSVKFAINDQVITTANVYVREEPSTSAKPLALIFKGSKGRVIGGPVFANNYYWWKISYELGLVGWSAEKYFSKVTAGSFVISSIVAITTVNTARFEWQTSIPTDAQVEYGLTSDYGNLSPLVSFLTTNHFITISNLIPNTNYHYRLISKEKTGGLVMSSDATFSTKVPSDLIPPSVSIISPLSGSIISGTSSLMATSSDNIRVSGVQFFVDDKPVGYEDGYAPFGVVWDSRSVLNGSHKITARAKDNVGNQTFSNPVSIITNNELSVKFAINDQVITTANVYVREEPSTSAKPLALIFKGSKGRVIGGPVFANNYYWWKISYELGLVGWSAEKYLVKPDILPPLVSFISPQNNSYVSGTVAISVSATDNVRVYKVEFYRNNVIVGTDFSAPYSILWNTKSFFAGQYTLSAKAYDATGNVGVATPVMVIISSSGGISDTVAPIVSITSPSNNAIVSSAVTVTASASDNVGVASVEFKIGTTSIGIDTTSPYSVSWNTVSFANNSYVLIAIAKDAAGNQTTSVAVNITVSNTIISPPDITSPSVPMNLTVTPISQAQLNLSWTASTDNVGVTGYKIFRGEVQVGTSVGTTYSNTGLTGTTTYSYQVSAYDAAGNESAKSVTVSGTTQSATSVKFKAGDRVQTTANVNVRSTPSISGTLLGTQILGAKGTIAGGPTVADGYTWWQVTYDVAPTSGWSVEDYLVLSTTDLTAPTISVTHSPTNPDPTQAVTLTASANDVNTGNSGIKEIRVYVDGILSKTCIFNPVCTSSSCTCTTDATTYSSGTHTYYATAVDGAPNSNLATDPTIGIKSFSVSISPITGFINVSGTNFILNGQPFYFAGSNAYWLPVYEKLNPNSVTLTLDFFVANNITVVRMWGFYDGKDCSYWSNDPIIQTAPNVYDEQSLVYLDRVIKKAKDRNIKLIVTFTNYWHELGGICQYAVWAGVGTGGNPTSAQAQWFYTNNTAKQMYKDYVNMLLNRVNTQTGIAYKDEPTIMAWELINEGRNPANAGSGIQIRDWYREMAQYVKSIDNKHLITTGEDGFDENQDNLGSQYNRSGYSNTFFMRSGEGTSYILNIQIPEIDFAQAHLYPDAYGFSTSNDYYYWIRDGGTYITDHKKIATQYNKPFIVAEYGSGWHDGWVADSSYKRARYESWWGTIEQTNTSGGLLWQFVRDTKCSESAGNICSTRDIQLSALLKIHATNMASKGGSPICTPGSVQPGTTCLVCNSQGTSYNQDNSKCSTGYICDANGQCITIIDTQIPIVTISFPSNGATFTSSNINVQGTSLDNVAVLGVKVRLNNGAWQTATGTNSWSIPLTLISGSNTIEAQAFDTNNNPSTIKSITVTYSTSPITETQIYEDSLLNPWVDFSYTSTRDYANSEQVYSGTKSIKVTQGAYGALAFRNPTAISSTTYSKVKFAIYGESSGLIMDVRLRNDASGTFPRVRTQNIPANTWIVIEIPMSQLNPNNLAFNSLSIEERSGIEKTFYVDEVKLIP
ncbi:MAG: Ig-like domain-containing protein [Patescibacteria group bacterium]|nr:Ig-like domain-containing protein [Patescibacteria group bacterium]